MCDAYVDGNAENISGVMESADNCRLISSFAFVFSWGIPTCSIHTVNGMNGVMERVHTISASLYIDFGEQGSG